MAGDIRGFASENRDGLTSLLSGLIAAQSVNPPGSENNPAQVAASFLSQHSIPFQKYERAPGRTNLVASLGSGAPVLGVICHLDTVPPGQGWEGDPFAAAVRDGKLYGRGSCDNKGQMAAVLMLARFLKDNGLPERGTFQIILAADEECGSRLGMEYLLAERIIKPDVAIVPDTPNHMKNIVISEKGVVFLRLHARGLQAHGSTPAKGKNAIMRMLRLLQEASGIDFKAPEHPLHSPPSVNIGKIKGGDAPNMVPAWCEADIDIRYVPGMTCGQVLARIDEVINKVHREVGEECFSRKIISDLPPHELSRDSLLVRLVSSCCLEALGYEPPPSGLG